MPTGLGVEADRTPPPSDPGPFSPTGKSSGKKPLSEGSVKKKPRKGSPASSISGECTMRDTREDKTGTPFSEVRAIACSLLLDRVL